MHWKTGIEWGLLGLGSFGLVTSTVFLGMVVVGVARFRRKAAEQEEMLREGQPFLPPVSLFKPLHGAEPGLEENLRGFYRQDYESSLREVLFCARNEEDAGLKIARRVAAEFPEVATRFVTSGEPWAANAKVCSLATMAKVAKNDLWVVSDSDVRVTPDYLRRLVLPFADAKVGCATCLYRGVAAEGGIWSRLEAVGMTIEMSSGVCVANLMEPMQFALGPTMVARRECVAEVGGFESMAEYCSDDFLLGNWIAAHGHEVVLSGHAIDHMVLHASFLNSMKHQVRWMKSTRFSRPKGHFGTSLTFGVPFGILAWAGAMLLGFEGLAWGLLAWSVAGRMLQAAVVGKLVVRKRRVWPTVLLYPMRDLMGILFWALSYTSNRILWRGEIYELVEDGKMVKSRR